MESPYAVNEYPSPFHSVRQLLERDFTTKVPMPAGSGLLYDSRLLHGSGENLSGRLRLACVCIVLPADVPPRVYVWDGVKPTRFDVLEVNREFLLEMERGAPVKKPYPPGVRYLASIDYPVQPLEPRDIAELERQP
jgi:ectoine hydroxylase-related dioxygenase (phytanoyl-CoA dioxygenase family)